MTSLFPHTPYAEDQPNAHAILYLHTIRAGAMVGSFVALITTPISLVASRYRHGTPISNTTLLPRLLTHTGRGLLFGSIFGAVATYGRMMGREEIEWQDRAWRLQENKGEPGTDWWALDGAAAGAAVAGLASRRGRLPVGFGKAVLGGAGLGMGTVGTQYMFYTFAMGRKPA